MVYSPMDKVVKDREILEGFIWKPKDRPISKEAIIPSLAKPKAKAQKAVTNKPPATKTQKPATKKPAGKKK